MGSSCVSILFSLLVLKTSCIRLYFFCWSLEVIHRPYLGFGLAFAYPARMVWSSLGYNLLIAALAIETFFLVNAFWIKAKVFLGTS